MICSYKFIKGKKKDKICSKINCKTHEKKNDKIENNLKSEGIGTSNIIDTNEGKLF